LPSRHSNERIIPYSRYIRARLNFTHTSLFRINSFNILIFFYKPRESDRVRSSHSYKTTIIIFLILERLSCLSEILPLVPTVVRCAILESGIVTRSVIDSADSPRVAACILFPTKIPDDKSCCSVIIFHSIIFSRDVFFHSRDSQIPVEPPKCCVRGDNLDISNTRGTTLGTCFHSRTRILEIMTRFFRTQEL